MSLPREVAPHFPRETGRNQKTRAARRASIGWLLVVVAAVVIAWRQPEIRHWGMVDQGGGGKYEPVGARCIRGDDCEIRLALVAKSMLLRVLLRRLLEEAATVKVVCEIAQVDTVPNAVEQSNANVLLASPTVTVSECQLLCQRLKHIPSPPSVVSLRIGLTPEGARDLAQGGVIGIDEEVTERELLTALRSRRNRPAICDSPRAPSP